MAQTISIGATQNIGALKARLGREMELFAREGLKLVFEENKAGKFTFLACRVSFNGSGEYSEEDYQMILKYFMAEIISDVILNYWGDTLLKDIIRTNYFYLGDEEKNLIFDYAARYAKRGENSWKEIGWLNRKNFILQKLLDFFHTNDSIIIDGFIKFRLKEYIYELHEAAEKAVDDFLMEREYREFIQLLKYFVEIQEPKIEMVNVLIKSSGTFHLFDEKMVPIKNDYMESTVLNLVDSEINYEDLLISALITIAPMKITLHYLHTDRQSSTTLETIKSVFTGRVLECPGCRICTTSMKI